ncbi:MAG: hypothetical protein HOO13_02670 [Nitrosomonadales bacterium]|nr:hypothetical protein [Nitrosomonadales bacterium]
MKLLTTIFLSLLIATGANAEQTPKQVLNQAFKSHEEKNFAAALEKFNKFVELAGDKPTMQKYKKKTLALIERIENIQRRESEKRKAAANSKPSNRYELDNKCRSAKPQWPYYTVHTGEDEVAKKRRWLAELETNQKELNLTYEECQQEKELKAEILNDIKDTIVRRARTKCMNSGAGSYTSDTEYSLRKINENIKRYNIDINKCPKEKREIARMVSSIKSQKNRMAELYEREQKEALKEAKKRNQALADNIAYFHSLGLLRKLSDQQLEIEVKKRTEILAKYDFNPSAWLKYNQEFSASNRVKKDSVKLWQSLYLNYMTIKFCDRNQGRFNLIQDIDEMKTKMSVINSTMLVYIDPDVLWSTTEDSQIITMLQKTDGVLSDTEFKRKMGRNCIQQQSALRLTYNEIMNEYGNQETKRKRKRKTKRDF